MSFHRSTSPTSPPRVRRLLHQAVMLIVESSEHFLGVIKAAKAKDNDVALRAVCSVDPQTGMPKIVRAAPLSLHSLEPHYAVTLAHLMDTVQPTQFVAWVTLESEDMPAAMLRGVDNANLVTLAVHTCAVIDAYQDRPVWEGPLHDPSPGPRGPPMSVFDDQSPAAARQQVLMEFRRAMGDDMTTVERLDEDSTFRGPSLAPEGAPGLTLSESQQRQLDDILAVTMLCSRATAKIMTSVLEAHARLDRLFDVVAPMMNTPHVTASMSSQLNSMESRLRVMEEHISSIRDRQDLVHSEVRQRIAARHDQGLQVAKANMADRWMQTEYFDIIHPEQLPRGTALSPRQARYESFPEAVAVAAPPPVASTYPSPPRQQSLQMAAAVVQAHSPSSAPPTDSSMGPSSPPRALPLRAKTAVNAAPRSAMKELPHLGVKTPPPPVNHRPTSGASHATTPPPQASESTLDARRPLPHQQPFHVMRPATGHFDAAMSDLDAPPTSLPVAAPTVAVPRSRTWGSPPVVPLH